MVMVYIILPNKTALTSWMLGKISTANGLPVPSVLVHSKRELAGPYYNFLKSTIVIFKTFLNANS